MKISGNKLSGIVYKNVDVEFDPAADIQVFWNESTQSFELMADPSEFTTIVHIVENSLTLQTGANEGNTLQLSIGDMSVSALGIDQVIVVSRETAANSISVLDNAITRVSAQRSKTGAYQNRLEITVSNLTSAFTHLTDATSRIRDADMAKEMMKFVKSQILNQAGTSVLAQANQIPKNLLSMLTL